jgi:hypothetical protein|nr:MAG TPA: hypothetical protein [Caudoviricetes sp.]
MAGLRSLFATSVSMLNTSVETLSTVVDCVFNGSQALANASDEYIKLQVAKHEALRTVRISETAREIAQAQIKEQDRNACFIKKYDPNGTIDLANQMEALVKALEKATK